jgi:hypothetical protein
VHRVLPAGSEQCGANRCISSLVCDGFWSRPRSACGHPFPSAPSSQILKASQTSRISAGAASVRSKCPSRTRSARAATRAAASPASTAIAFHLGRELDRKSRIPPSLFVQLPQVQHRPRHEPDQRLLHGRKGRPPRPRPRCAALAWAKSRLEACAAAILGKPGRRRRRRCSGAAPRAGGGAWRYRWRSGLVAIAGEQGWVMPTHRRLLRLVRRDAHLVRPAVIRQVEALCGSKARCRS